MIFRNENILWDKLRFKIYFTCFFLSKLCLCLWLEEYFTWDCFWNCTDQCQYSVWATGLNEVLIWMGFYLGLIQSSTACAAAASHNSQTHRGRIWKRLSHTTRVHACTDGAREFHRITIFLGSCCCKHNKRYEQYNNSCDRSSCCTRHSKLFAYSARPTVLWWWAIEH